MAFDGKGSEERRRKSKKCRKCKQAGEVYFLGTEVLHGNPYTPAADTEVEHYFECRNCGHEWSEYA